MSVETLAYIMESVLESLCVTCGGVSLLQVSIVGISDIYRKRPCVTSRYVSKEGAGPTTRTWLSFSRVLPRQPSSSDPSPEAGVRVGQSDAW